MPASRRQDAVRRYKRVVQPLLQKYGLHAFPANDPSLPELQTRHRALLKKVHPDKGGDPNDFNTALEAKKQLDRDVAGCESPSVSSPRTCAERTSGEREPVSGAARAFKRPAAAAAHCSPALRVRTLAPDIAPEPPTDIAVLSMDLCEFCSQLPAKRFRIQSTGVLLTYNGASLAESDTWLAFKQWVFEHVREWCVLYHCGTKEREEGGMRKREEERRRTEEGGGSMEGGGGKQRTRRNKSELLLLLHPHDPPSPPRLLAHLCPRAGRSN